MLFRFLVFVFLSAGLLFIVDCKGRKEKESEEVVEAVYLNHNDTVRYVGKEKCIMCHYDHYETYRHTGMGLSFDKATRQKSASVLDEKSVIYDQYHDLYYHPYWDDSVLKVMEYRLNAKGDTVHRRIQQVTHIVGSGQHTNSHMYNVNGYFYQIPFTFYTQDGILDFPPGFENGENSRFGRIIALECISCHNGLPEMVLGSENKYTKMPSGIDCERCHGPGEVHWQRMTANQLVDTSQRPDYSIVNPARLSAKLVNDLCARCHLQGTTVLKEGKNYYDFKPGMEMTEVMDVFQPWYEGGKESFIMASHYERMVLSECYIKSGEQLTCIACHNPHVSHLETPLSSYEKVCAGCHDNQRHSFCTLPEKDRSGKACVECHMRLSTTSDIPHVKIHDHRISLPPTDSSLKTKRVFKGLKAFNNWNTDSLSMAMGYLREYESYTDEQSYLDSAFAYLEKYRNTEDDFVYNVWIDYYFLKKDYDAIVRRVEKTGIAKVLDEYFTTRNYNNYDGWAAYRTGQAFDNENRLSVARRFYRKAVDLVPYNLQFQNKYAAVSVKLGDVAEAKKILLWAVSEDSLLPISHLNLGYVYSLENDFEKAKQHYRKALALNPDYLQALINIAGICYLEGDRQKAKMYLKRAERIAPDHPQIREMLKALSQRPE